MMYSGCGACSDVKAGRRDSQSHRRSHVSDARQTGNDVSVARRQKTTRRGRCTSAAQRDRLSDHRNEHRYYFNGRPIFCPVVSSFFLLSFYLFSSPILSRPRLDVYHTSTHDVVALVEFRMQV